MESARRGALDTCRCWDRKERVGEEKEELVRPPRRDSIASFWKFRLWRGKNSTVGRSGSHYECEKQKKSRRYLVVPRGDDQLLLVLPQPGLLALTLHRKTTRVTHECRDPKNWAVLATASPPG